MADLSAAIAAAREALTYYDCLAECNADYDPCAHKITDNLRDLLAALDAAQGEADMVAMFQHDETGRTTCVPASEAADFARLNPRWERIGSGLAPQAPPAAAPAGYALVPVEPTDEMLGAGACFVFNAVQTEAADSYKVTEAVWSAMIAAALDEWLGPLNEAEAARACEAICKALLATAREGA